MIIDCMLIRSEDKKHVQNAQNMMVLDDENDQC